MKSKADTVFKQTASVKKMKKLFLGGKTKNEEMETNRPSYSFDHILQELEDSDDNNPIEDQTSVFITKKKKMNLFDNEDSEPDFDRSSWPQRTLLSQKEWNKENKNVILKDLRDIDEGSNPDGEKVGKASFLVVNEKKKERKRAVQTLAEEQKRPKKKAKKGKKLA